MPDYFNNYNIIIKKTLFLFFSVIKVKKLEQTFVPYFNFFTFAV